MAFKDRQGQCKMKVHVNSLLTTKKNELSIFINTYDIIHAIILVNFHAIIHDIIHAIIQAIIHAIIHSISHDIMHDMIHHIIHTILFMILFMLLFVF